MKWYRIMLWFPIIGVMTAFLDREDRQVGIENPIITFTSATWHAIWLVILLIIIGSIK